VTCRVGDYARLRDTLRPATEVVIRPLDVDQIEQYVEREIGAYYDRPAWGQWQQLLARLGDPDDRRLLSRPGTPWRLTLAVTLSMGGQDIRLLLPDASEQPSPGQVPTDDQSARYATRVSDALLAAFIPARTRLYGAGRYEPDRVLAWVRRWHGFVATALVIMMALLMGVAVNHGARAGIDNVRFT
jgi:hypothetical protein